MGCKADWHNKMIVAVFSSSLFSGKTYLVGKTFHVYKQFMMIKQKVLLCGCLDCVELCFFGFLLLIVLMFSLTTV